MLQGGLTRGHSRVLDRLKIKDLRILNLNHEVSPNGDEVTLKMPMALNASLSL